MPDDFDPYYLWLGIPPRERPANHYRLLGIALFEDNPTVIESAADRQMAHLRSFQAGKHSALSQRLLNEVAAAKVCLLRADQKSRYDAALQAKLSEHVSRPGGAAAVPPLPSAAVQPTPLARAQPIPTGAPEESEAADFWDDVTGGAARRSSIKPGAPQKRTSVAQTTHLKKLWPLYAAIAACALVGIVVLAMNPSASRTDHSATNSTSSGGSAGVGVKGKNSVLTFDWPADIRVSLALTVDGTKVLAPASGPWIFRCSAGAHRVVASRPNFKLIDRKIDAPTGGELRIADAWQPAAALALDWPVENRVGAVLNVDGQLTAVGTDQPLIVPVSPGAHSLRISRIGFVPLERSVTVGSDEQQDVKIALEPTAAMLVIHWPSKDRAGAEIQIDGQTRSEASSPADNIVLVLPPGEHTVQIKRSGFEPILQSVTLTEGRRRFFSPTWIVAANTQANSTTPATSTKPTDSDADATPEEKKPAPSEADQQRIAKQLDAMYKLSRDPSKGLAQAKDLRDSAQKAQYPAEQYMLLLRAADFAVESGDFALAQQIVESLDTEFVISRLELKERLLEKFAKSPVGGDQAADAVNAAERSIEDAISADRFDLANALILTTNKLLGKHGVDSDLRLDAEKALSTYRAQIKTLASQLDKVQKARQTLASKPDDADANGILGRWYCFYKGEWKTGLPYFDKSGSDKIAPVAKRDLQSPTDAGEIRQLADQWWDISLKEVGIAADAIRLHAGDLYRAARPGLKSVVESGPVERRLVEVDEIRSRVGDAAGQHSGPMLLQRNRWYDIIKLIDLKADVAAGNWTRNENQLLGQFGNGSPRIHFPVVVTGGYDLVIDFSVSGNSPNLHTTFFIGDHPAGLTLAEGGYSGLDLANGRTMHDFARNPYERTGFHPIAGQRYEQIISVRAVKGGASVDIGIDGRQFLTHWQGNPSTPMAIGVDTNPAPTQFAFEMRSGPTLTLYAVRMKIVSGQGRVERPGDSSDVSPAGSKRTVGASAGN